MQTIIEQYFLDRNNRPGPLNIVGHILMYCLWVEWFNLFFYSRVLNFCIDKLKMFLYGQNGE